MLVKLNKNTSKSIY